MQNLIKSGVNFKELDLIGFKLHLTEVAQFTLGCEEPEQLILPELELYNENTGEMFHFHLTPDGWNKLLRKLDELKLEALSK